MCKLCILIPTSSSFSLTIKQNGSEAILDNWLGLCPARRRGFEREGYPFRAQPCGCSKWRAQRGRISEETAVWTDPIHRTPLYSPGIQGFPAYTGSRTTMALFCTKAVPFADTSKPSIRERVSSSHLLLMMRKRLASSSRQRASRFATSTPA